MEQREKDIQELCRQVKGAYLVPETRDCGYTLCPFCNHKGAWNADFVEEIEHNSNCAYLIAKDLSTNINH